MLAAIGMVSLGMFTLGMVTAANAQTLVAPQLNAADQLGPPRLQQTPSLATEAELVPAEKQNWRASTANAQTLTVPQLNAADQLGPPRLPQTPSLATEAELVPVEKQNPVRDKIRNALDGDQPARQADPVLDEMLQIIRRKGSVLKGSVLDAELNTEDSELARSVSNENAWAAESLLRAARTLSKLKPLDAQQRDMVNRMRHEAAKLLQP